jgi:hypothetical protein
VGTDERMERPGASSVRNDAEFEKAAIWSAFDTAPTLIAELMQPGANSAFELDSLPDAATVAMPTERSRSMISLRAASVAAQAACDAKLPPPRLMFAAAMLYVLRSS